MVTIESHGGNVSFLSLRVMFFAIDILTFLIDQKKEQADAVQKEDK